MENAAGKLVTRLILASASPRRAALLRAAGVAFEVVPADIDESPLAGESAEAYVERLARGKAETVWRQRRDAFVLGADTTVVDDGEILGKPVDAAEATRMLERLSGRPHRVLTGVCLFGPAGLIRSEVAATDVTFRRLGRAEIEAYVAGGEPLDKAGAYAVQGGAAGFVDHIEGSYANVVGLPVELVAVWCRDFGIQVS